MEIPRKVREELDKLYEAYDNFDYIIDYKGTYLPKNGGIFKIRHYHHIDHDRTNNEIWNLVPLSYDDHIIQLHTKENQLVKNQIYEFMVNQFPDYELHYKKYLIGGVL